MAVLDTRTGYRGAGAVGGHWRLRLPVYLFEPRVQVRDGALPERDNALLTSLSMQMYGECAIDEEVGDT